MLVFDFLKVVKITKEMNYQVNEGEVTSLTPYTLLAVSIEDTIDDVENRYLNLKQNWNARLKASMNNDELDPTIWIKKIVALEEIFDLLTSEVEQVEITDNTFHFTAKK